MVVHPKRRHRYVGRLFCRIEDFMQGGMVGVESNFMFKMAIKIYRSIN